MVILSVDPGLVAGAYVIIKDDKLLNYHTFKFKSKSKLSQGHRLNYVYELFLPQIKEYNVDTIVTERQFFGPMSKAQTPVEMVCGKYDLKFEQMQSTHWKKVLTGHGKQTKKEIQEYIKINYEHLYNQIDDKNRNEHVMDALAMAIAFLKKQEIK